MSRKHPTPVSFARAIYLCVLAICRPEKFAQLESSDNALLNASPDAPHIESIRQIRGALLSSLLLVLAAAALGLLLGCALRAAYGPAGTNTVAALQAAGALILLWATLAVRGWDILTFVAVTYSERVNQWIYRFLYCVGTSIVVWSLAWQAPSAG
jgi:hypothetical protein